MVTDERIPPRTAGLLFVVFIVFSLLLMILSTGIAVLRPKDTALRVGSTVQSTTHAIGTFFSRTVTSIRELSELRNEYTALLERVRTLEATETDMEQLRNEIKELRNILELFGRNRAPQSPCAGYRKGSRLALRKLRY